MKTNSDKPKVDLTSYSGKTLSEYFGNLFSHIFDLRDGLDRKGTVERIKSNIVMQGANVWLLICSIFVASLGLDLNSSAVIIGAMLISPLMSPILGIGLAVGIYDRKLLAKSLINYGIALFIALTTSIIYFYLTPFGAETPEIMARTQPHLLDVLVAFFGGVAGIVASSRKDLINAVPGVAIATALMPPVCVAGFGIANLNWEIFSGAIYLFFLNTVFVALATYLIVRLLRYPYKEYLNDNDKKRNQLFIFLFVGLVTLPSILKMMEIISDIRTENQIKNYLRASLSEYDGEIQDIIINENKENDSRKVSVYLYGTPIEDADEFNMYKHIKSTLCANCENLDLNYSSVELPDMGKFGNDLEQKYNLKLTHSTEQLEAKINAKLDSIQIELANFAIKDTTQRVSLSITEKVDTLFNEITQFWIGDLEMSNFETKENAIETTALIKFKKGINSYDKKKVLKRLSTFLNTEMNDTIEVKEW